MCFQMSALFVEFLIKEYNVQIVAVTVGLIICSLLSV
jgi:hypothetical protein